MQTARCVIAVWFESSARYVTTSFLGTELKVTQRKLQKSLRTKQSDKENLQQSHFIIYWIRSGHKMVSGCEKWCLTQNLR